MEKINRSRRKKQEMANTKLPEGTAESPPVLLSYFFLLVELSFCFEIF